MVAVVQTAESQEQVPERSVLRLTSNSVFLVWYWVLMRTRLRFRTSRLLKRRLVSSLKPNSGLVAWTCCLQSRK